MAALSGGFAFRPGWGIPRNPLYSVFKEQEGVVFPLTTPFHNFFEFAQLYFENSLSFFNAVVFR